MNPARLHLGFSDTHAAPALPAASHDLPDLLNGRPCDPRRLREQFPELWSGFLRANYRDSEEVAFTYGVSEKAARNWIEGRTGPQGWAVDFAILTKRTAVSYLRLVQ